MSYVMVPVPEEHVEAVMQFVLRAIARANIEAWTEESVTEVYGEIDEASRSLLAVVARLAASGDAVDVTEAARQIQLNPREAVGIVNELSSLTRDRNRPSLMVLRSVTERLPNGRTKARRLIDIDPELADLVRAAEKAELADVTSPLEDDGS